MKRRKTGDGRPKTQYRGLSVSGLRSSVSQQSIQLTTLTGGDTLVVNAIALCAVLPLDVINVTAGRSSGVTSNVKHFEQAAMSLQLPSIRRAE